MDRQIIYPGQIAVETDLLNTNRNTMIAIGKLAGALFGTGGVTNGLVVGPSSPAALTVDVAPGEIYQLENVDNTAYSSLPADTTDAILKQGIMLAKQTLACAAPSTTGYSINYLIQATYQDSDTGAVALPYYNASNPAQAYSGPNNTGATQATKRAGIVVVSAKAGTAATTGTQTTPAADSGYIALASVTVANGQATITSGNITAIAPASPPMVDTSAIYADLASTATGKGAALVGFLQSGANAVPRTTQDKQRDHINARDFDLASYPDDAGMVIAAIAEAKRRGGGTVELPEGELLISQTITIDTGVRLMGRGVRSLSGSSGTTLKWVGASGGIVVNVDGSIEGVHLEGFGIDCNDLANYGLVCNRQRFSMFKNIRIRNFLAGGMYIYVTGSVGPDDNFMFNTIENLACESSHAVAIGLRLRGTATGNPCHNTFTNIMLTHANVGLYLDDCDNNLFQQVICLQSAVVPYDVYLSGPTDTAFGARANYFVHLQGVIHAISGTKNLVFGYDRENGQAAPTIDAGAQLLVIGSGNNAAPWVLTERLQGLMAYLTGDPNSAATDVDPTVFGMFRGDLGAKVLWGINNSPREVRSFVSTDGTGPTQWLGVTNSGVSMMRVGGMLQTSAAAMPTTGSWTAGDIVWCTVPVSGSMAAGNFTLLGWRRMTTGSGNVLNTDWSPMRCLTGT